MNEGRDAMHGHALHEVRVGFNAVPILSPLTGVGQYTWRLATEMRKLLALPPWLFYGTSWGQDIRTTAAPAVRQAHRAIMRFLPRPHVVERLLKQARFSMGARRHRIGLYHEPAYLAFRFDGPSVVTVHDLSWIRHPDAHPADRVREMNRVLPGAIERAAHIVVDSDFVRREVMDYYRVAPERITTVPLGVGPEFRPMDAECCMPVLNKHGLRHGAYLLAVGTLEPRKNLATVVTAYGRLPAALRRRYPLVIAGMKGWGMDRFSDSLRQLLARGELLLPGYIAQEDLPALYAGARLLLYPSLYEGFGLPPLEAMASGVPVIVSNSASLPEVVGDAGVLVDALDDVAIAQHMQALIEDDRLHRAYADAGRQRAAQFTWRAFALRMLDVYRKALD